MTREAALLTDRSPALRPCPVCGQEPNERFFTFPSVPVFCNVLLPDRDQAISAPMAPIDLAFCGGCGHIYNDSFDPSLVAYSPRYENSLHHSGVFREYASDLVRELVEQHGLRGKKVLEIGCGQGDFLSELCIAGGNIGVGFDPSFAGGSLPPGVERIEQAYFTPEFMDILPDAIVCRQVLEHIDDPAGFLAMIREAIGNRDVFVFFEVPNGLWCFGGGGIWDVIYEHCGYFTPQSLERAFHRNSFRVLELREAFGGQFLTVAARPAVADHGPVESAGNLAPLANQVMRSAEAMAQGITRWREELLRLGREFGSVVIWGAGSKGVTFLNIADPDRLVASAVDLNPQKQHMFVPGSGQQIEAPERLTSHSPGAVLVMNPNYLTEIVSQLDSLTIDAKVVVASGELDVIESSC